MCTTLQYFIYSLFVSLLGRQVSEIKGKGKGKDVRFNIYFREGFNKKTLKVMEFSIQILPPPPFDGIKTFVFHNFVLCLHCVSFDQIWREL